MLFDASQTHNQRRQQATILTTPGGVKRLFILCLPRLHSWIFLLGNDIQSLMRRMSCWMRTRREFGSGNKRHDGRNVYTPSYKQIWRNTRCQWPAFSNLAVARPCVRPKSSGSNRGNRLFRGEAKKSSCVSRRTVFRDRDKICRQDAPSKNTWGGRCVCKFPKIICSSSDLI